MVSRPDGRHGALAFAMATYLVTGGAGFIGSHLAETLHDQGHRVRVVDNIVTGKWANLAHLDSIDAMEGDLGDLEVARRAVDGMEYVLHQAAIPSVPRSVKDPIGSHLANVTASLNVLVAARDAGVRRVVYAGSSSAYGDGLELPKREDMDGRVLSPYALQKKMSEEYASLFTQLYGLETVTIRYFNVFGPRQDPSSPYSGVISLFITSLLDGRRPVIYGDGEQTRDFTYVSNVVDGVLRACEADASGRVINVATGGRVSINQLFRTVARLVGTSLDPIYAEARAGDVRHSQAAIELAKGLLGYEPLIGFEEGLRRTVDWYRESRRV
jgi:nucleoside-diphosphate-sugar epimerase